MLDSSISLLVNLAGLMLFVGVAIVVVLTVHMLWQWIDERRRVIVIVRHVDPAAPNFDFPER